MTGRPLLCLAGHVERSCYFVGVLLCFSPLLLLPVDHIAPQVTVLDRRGELLGNFKDNPWHK